MKFADFRVFWITVERCGTEEPIRPFGALNETLKRSFEGKCSAIQPEWQKMFCHSTTVRL